MGDLVPSRPTPTLPESAWIHRAAVLAGWRRCAPRDQSDARDTGDPGYACNQILEVGDGRPKHATVWASVGVAPNKRFEHLRDEYHPNPLAFSREQNQSRLTERMIWSVLRKMRNLS
ncbi:hypothetical protein [Bradyrhizobium guangdongense]|uniref:hypothetical protein n=1 Tax=Bradyrhizobium guangdongense TaxID=1325090 RepID=UPI00131A4608|nr:hypothetical protein [Bradyrhizobium guangdongense]